jgi:hypothetical protein
MIITQIFGNLLLPNKKRLDIDNLCGPKKNSKKYYPDIILKKEITGQHWYIRTQIHKNIGNSFVLGFTIIYTLDKTETPQPQIQICTQYTDN